MTAAVALARFCAAHRAAAEPLACETRSAREHDEIVVPLSDGDTPELPEQAVRIAPGETLCITGSRDSNGELSNLRLLANDGDAKGIVVRVRMTRDRDTRLWIDHGSSGDELRYRAWIVVTPQNLSVPAHTLPVEAHATRVERWGRHVRELLLFGFELGEPPATPTPRPNQRTARDPGVLNASVTAGIGLGERRLRLDALNRALARDGFAPLPESGFEVGLELDFTLGRARVGISLAGSGRSTRHRITGEELSSWLGDVGFIGGVDVLRSEQLSVFLATGIHVGHLRLDARADGSTLFRDLRPWESDHVSISHVGWPLEAGTEYLFPLGRVSPTERWVVQLGGRIGWVQQIGSGGWTTEDDEPRELEGPPVNVSGLRARVLLGVGAQNGW